MSLPIEALLVALQASPENAALHAVVVDACLDAGDFAALKRAHDIVGASLLADDALRARVLRAAQEAGDDALLLALGGDDSAEGLFARARLALREGRRDEARAAYARAVERNPALEDRAFAAELDGKVVSIAGRGRAVASIANDDTAEADIVRLVHPAQDRQTFADVGGLEDVKQQVRRRIITPFLKPSLFDRF